MFISNRIGIFLVAILADFANSYDFQNDRIVNGKLITITKAPYIVQLRHRNGTQFCAGTLVSPRFVVTAAHCFVSIPVEEYVVVGDVSKRSEEGRNYAIEKLFITDFSTKTMHNDIAVLKLTEEMTGEFVKPIGLCNDTLKEHDSIAILGWGRTANKGPISEQLRYDHVPVTSDKYCRDVYRNAQHPGNITDSMVCAFIPGLKDSCFYDSGGPAIYNEGLCAVISSGYECASTTLPGIYTRISAVRDFIEDAMLE